MAQLVSCKIHGSSQASKASMRHTATPHQLAHGLIVLAVSQGLATELHHVLNQFLSHSIGKIIALSMRHIPFQGMHNNICGTTGNLIRRQSIGQLWIHNSKFRPVQIRIGATFFAYFIIGQHCRITGFTTCCRNSQHRSYWCALGNRQSTTPIFPNIHIWSSNTMSNSLGCIQHTAAAYTQNKICLEIQSLLNPLSSLGHQRIWLYSTHRVIRQTCPIQLVLQLSQQTASYHTAATVNDKYPASSMLFNFICSLAFSPFAKNNLRWTIIFKTLHKNPSCY